MTRWLSMVALVLAARLAAAAVAHATETPDDNAATVIVVVGAAGSDEYGKRFAEWAARWKAASERGHAEFLAVGPHEAPSAGETPENASTVSTEAPPQADRDALREAIAKIAARGAHVSRQTWIVLIGHGTFDGKKAKFNLRGADVTADELADWLKDVESPLAIVNCASASGPFINRLSGPNRAIVAATKSGAQYNFARFGDYMSAAIGDAALDLDKDQQTSLLEEYLAASARTAEFYKQEARLATEHSLLDDNGDGLGTPADWFRGFRAVRQAKSGASADGELAARFVLVRGGQEQAMPAELAAMRDAIEIRIARLRAQKQALGEAEYYKRLEAMLIELAACYEEAEAAGETAKPKAADPNGGS